MSGTGILGLPSTPLGSSYQYTIKQVLAILISGTGILGLPCTPLGSGHHTITARALMHSSSRSSFLKSSGSGNSGTFDLKASSEHTSHTDTHIHNAMHCF
jgi:hypothetical protein